MMAYAENARDYSMTLYLREWSVEHEGVGDAFTMDDEELQGLTILDCPHITGLGSIVGLHSKEL
jgi:hypothetical protein